MTWMDHEEWKTRMRAKITCVEAVGHELTRPKRLTEICCLYISLGNIRYPRLTWNLGSGGQGVLRRWLILGEGIGPAE